MNDIINWIATHDTLLIRVGFTAILVLVIVYVYRFFFVPKINIVVETPSAVSGDKATTTEAGKAADEKAPAAQPSFDLSVVAKKTEEIESLKLEVTKLKTQVGDSEKIISDLKEKAEAAAAQSTTAGAENSGTNSGAAVAGGASADPNLVATLNSQIEQLQNRLAEYEIIAEDISEISQLRQENAELKKKLGASPTPVAEAAPAVESVQEEPKAEFNEPTPSTTVEEAPPEETPAEPVVAEVAEEAPVAAAETASEQAERKSAESIKLVSDKEVTSAEKELINQFEEVLTKKGS